MHCPRAALIALTATAGIPVVGCTGGTDCQLAFVVDAAPCDVDGCVVDFGTVAPNLSETLRVSWSGACDNNALVDAPAISEGIDTFRLGASNTFLGERGDEGFAFVSATPVDNQPVHGTLSLPPHSIALVVNGD
jgi:hypothetical protein